MHHTIYEDYKYSMQDIHKLYVGCKYTMGELIEAEGMMFKFRLIVERYILPEADPEDTLETHLYYLKPESFLVKIYGQLKAKVKINIIEEKRGKQQYVTKVLPVSELVAMPVAEKEKRGVVVQELSMSKLAVMSF